MNRNGRQFEHWIDDFYNEDKEFVLVDDLRDMYLLDKRIEELFDRGRAPKEAFAIIIRFISLYKIGKQ